MLQIPLFLFEPECPDYHWTNCETTFTICLVFPVESSNSTVHFRCEWAEFSSFPYKWESGIIFFKESADYWTPVFVEKSIKMNCKFLIMPSPVDRHHNQVGRWLTNFRATWDPKFDSYAVVGSMKQPRQVRLSEVCGFSIVWCSHVKSNVSGRSRTLVGDFL